MENTLLKKSTRIDRLHKRNLELTGLYRLSEV